MKVRAKKVNGVTIKSAFSPELCAREILDEAIDVVDTVSVTYANQAKDAISYYAEIIEALEKLKEKYNDR